jgi:hypothetical protein
VVGEYGLTPVPPQPVLEPITADDLGVVCWMRVLAGDAVVHIDSCQLASDLEDWASGRSLIQRPGPTPEPLCGHVNPVAAAILRRSCDQDVPIGFIIDGTTPSNRM